MKRLDWDGKWFECARDNDSVALTTEQLEVWIDNLDAQMSMNVWHRYVLTRGGTRYLINWMKKQFFFRNATKDQLTRIDAFIKTV